MKKRIRLNAVEMASPLQDNAAYVIPAMAAVTEHLGFAVTSSITYDHPYSLARKFSTLDHLTNGRVSTWQSPHHNGHQ
ncbi:unnamed protein product, partial [Mesorhabditis spiculigera]